ncbi:ATP-binding protein [Rhizosaccharibacter radicis]|uniref:histidine kinase n=1 Tax=Rhizosaccharibacter radicis TaxID=2782605 RepID=A0ABT1VVI2_9PROT|nr:ATP-binding protein [Acetobacteraceae bacterium KSS12]
MSAAGTEVAPGDGAIGSACDREPVHAPGAIQPHGILLLVRPDPATGGFAVAVASANAPGLGDRLSPVPLGDVLAPDGAAVVAASFRLLAPGEDRLLDAPVRDRNGREWLGLLHCEDGAALLELEPPDPGAEGGGGASRSAGTPPTGTSSVHRAMFRLNDALLELQRQPDAAGACRVAAAAMRETTGFDRVMAYRFMPDWSGEVLAEALVPDRSCDSFHGLVFPASDIPAPARALYQHNRIRLIPDAAAGSVELIALDPQFAGGAGRGSGLDLTRAVLRAVAPVHLRYLANMGVHASMSVAISTRHQPLWGLFACHHQHGPVFVDGLTRQAAEIIGRALSWRLSELQDAETARRLSRLDDAKRPFLAAAPGGDSRRAGAEQPPDATAGAALLAAIGADGMAVVGAAAQEMLPPWRLGVCPPEDGLSALVGWLDERVTHELHGNGPAGPARHEPEGGHDPATPFCTDRLGELVPERLRALLGPDAPCGLLAVPLGAGGYRSGWVLWFRGELRRTVFWAGHKPEATDPLQQLTPRASFAAWREEVAGRSAFWPDWSADTARRFGADLVSALAARSLEIERHNAELRERNEAIRFFADAAAHDLREPLWQVQILSGLIRESLDSLLSPDSGITTVAELLTEAAALELGGMATSVVTSADRMRRMIDDLSRYAVAGRDPDRVETVLLRELAEESLADLGEPVRRAAIDGRPPVIRLDGLDEVSARCDPAQLRRVFQNLLSNALKYRDRSRDLRVEMSAVPTGHGAEIEVRDNGCGFDPAMADRMFEPFQRLRGAHGDDVEGLGLGLAICRRIVEAHDGRIVSEGRPGEGATFRFHIGEPVEDPVRWPVAAGFDGHPGGGGRAA